LKWAEGAYGRGKNRQARHQAAAACAREALACLETAEALDGKQPLEKELGALFHRVISTLVRLMSLGAEPGSLGGLRPPELTSAHPPSQTVLLP
jgi:hypothetical protein